MAISNQSNIKIQSPNLTLRGHTGEDGARAERLSKPWGTEHLGSSHTNIQHCTADSVTTRRLLPNGASYTERTRLSRDLKHDM